jgi:hypothetical protein
MAATQSTTIAIRSYRIYLRDAENVLAKGHDADLASDEDARELAALMLNERTAYPCAEVWDRARLVCTRAPGRIITRAMFPERLRTRSKLSPFTNRKGTK